MEPLRRYWLLFAQTCAALVLVLAALLALDRLFPGILPAHVDLANLANPGRAGQTAAETPRSYAEAARQAQRAVVSISTRLAGKENPVPKYRIHPPEAVAGLGSGVIVNANGYILTNHHVVSRADTINIALPDGRRLPARLVGDDPETDLAVLRIEAGGLPAITFADDDSLKVGDVVLAVGNPFGVGETVTMGIVSALNRTHLGINTFERFIQTDAAINPGNSGGALVDTAGRLVGINAAIYSKSGGNEGIGFAIPVSLARDVLQQIITQGSVTRGWIGVALAEITPEVARQLRLRNRDGVLIEGVYQDGPAARAGVQPGDVLLALNEQGLRDARALLDRLAAMQPGQVASLDIWREGRRMKISARVGKRPPARAEED